VFSLPREKPPPVFEPGIGRFAREEHLEREECSLQAPVVDAMVVEYGAIGGAGDVATVAVGR
jgi:hypothetical protein